MPVSSRTSTPAFSPACLTCNYDLSATPDGRCPECGNEFTRAAIANLALQRLKQPGKLGWALRVVSAAIVLWAVNHTLLYFIQFQYLWYANLHKLALMLAGVWLLALAEALRVARGQQATALALLLATAATGWLGLVSASHPLGAAALTACPMLVGFVCRVRYRSPRIFWVGMLAAGSVLTVAGASWTAHGLGRIACGAPMSGLAWWPEPYYTGRHNITTDAALAIGSAFLAVGGPSAAIAALRLERRRGSPTP